jgi:hypothetical protein
MSARQLITHFSNRRGLNAVYRDKSLPEYADVMNLYQQWYAALTQAAQQQVKEFGYAVLVDCWKQS